MKNLFKPTITVAFLAVILFSCGTTQGQTEVTVVDADKLVELQSMGVIVIDVRTPEEVAEGKIPGAINIPLSDTIVADMSKIGKDQAVAVYCRSGGRSTRASEVLKNAGYKTIYNYTGSMNDWLAKKKPVE